MTDESMREMYDRAMEYATPSGRDIEAGELPHEIEYLGVKYRSISSPHSADEPCYTHQALAIFHDGIVPGPRGEELGADGDWSIRLYGDNDGPETEDGDRPFSLTIVWTVAGQLQAVFGTVSGGPVGTGPELIRDGLDSATVLELYKIGENYILPAMNRVIGAE